MNYENPTLKDMILSCNDVAKYSRALIGGMLTVAIVLVATMLATSDEAVFRDEAKVFPIIGIEVKLSTSYIVVPIIFIFMHINTLLQLNILKKRLIVFNKYMEINKLTKINKDMWKNQLCGLPYVDLIIRVERFGFGVFLKYVLTIISLFVLPILLLITTELSFLRYQSIYITSFHQICIIVDAVVLLWFFNSPSYEGNAKYKNIKRVFSFSIICSILISNGAVAWPLLQTPYVFVDKNNILDHGIIYHNFPWTHRVLDLHGKFIFGEEIPAQILSSMDYDENTRNDFQRKYSGIELKSRNFIGIDLTGATIVAANFEFSNLSMANISNSNLRNANFAGATVLNTKFISSYLQDTSWNSAHMEGADFRSANLEGSILSFVNAVGTSFRGANLLGVFSWGGHFELADFLAADLSAAQFSDSYFDGAFTTPELTHYMTAAPKSCKFVAAIGKLAVHLYGGTDRDNENTIINNVKSSKMGNKDDIYKKFVYIRKRYMDVCEDGTNLNIYNEPNIDDLVGLWKNIACKNKFTAIGALSGATYLGTDLERQTGELPKSEISHRIFTNIINDSDNCNGVKELLRDSPVYQYSINYISKQFKN